MKRVQFIIVVPTEKSAHAPRNFNCRQTREMLDVHHALSSTSELYGLTLEFQLKASFDEEPEAKNNRVLRETPAAYRHSNKKILVNKREFFKLPSNEQEAILVHEIAHAYFDIRKLRSEERLGFALLSEDVRMDLLVCRWGFSKALARSRVFSYGQRYSDILLDLWDHEEMYIAAMHKWEAQFRAGLIQIKRRN